MCPRAWHVAGLLVLAAAPTAAQQSSRPYTEGSVTAVAYVRVKPGRFDDYMAYLAGPYKQLLEAQKKTCNLLVASGLLGRLCWLYFIPGSDC